MRILSGFRASAVYWIAEKRQLGDADHAEYCAENFPRNEPDGFQGSGVGRALARTYFFESVSFSSCREINRIVSMLPCY